MPLYPSPGVPISRVVTIVYGPFACRFGEFTGIEIVSGSVPAVFEAMTFPFLSSTKEPYS